jgi:hypothetical protein
MERTSDPELGGVTFSNFNADAIQEVQSSSGVMPAEIGHGAASFTNVMDWSGFAPRVSVDYAVTPHTVIHAGGAITTILPNLWQDNFVTGGIPLLFSRWSPLCPEPLCLFTTPLCLCPFLSRTPSADNFSSPMATVPPWQRTRKLI